MPHPSISMGPRRYSLARAMLFIAILAANLAALRTILPITLPIDPGAPPNNTLPPSYWREHLPTFPDLGLVLMIVILEVGLCRLLFRRGVARAFWLGFQVAGWAYAITCLAYTATTWRLAYALFEGYVPGRPMGRPFDMDRFILGAGGLHLLIALALASLVGVIARSAWHRSGAA